MYWGNGEPAMGSEANSFFGLKLEADPMTGTGPPLTYQRTLDLRSSQWRNFTRPISAGATTVQLDMNLYLAGLSPPGTTSCIFMDYMTTA
jgi:hypothetical protein